MPGPVAKEQSHAPPRYCHVDSSLCPVPTDQSNACSRFTWLSPLFVHFTLPLNLDHRECLPLSSPPRWQIVYFLPICPSIISLILKTLIYPLSLRISLRLPSHRLSYFSSSLSLSMYVNKYAVAAFAAVVSLPLSFAQVTTSCQPLNGTTCLISMPQSESNIHFRHLPSRCGSCDKFLLRRLHKSNLSP